MTSFGRILRILVTASVVTVLLGPSVWADSTVDGAGLIFAAKVEGTVEGNPYFDPNSPYPHMQTRAADAVLGVSYGVVNWGGGFCTAGQQHRLGKWDDPDDDYERLGTWGVSDTWRSPFQPTRGLVRYDQDTFLALGGNYSVHNANGSRPPVLFQLEYRGDWFSTAPYTADQYADWLSFDSMYLLRASPQPPPQWGPRPQSTFLTPPGPADWTWTGCGTTGKLQIADAATISGSYAWNNDPNVNPTYDYITFSTPTNFRQVDNASNRDAGDLYKGSGYGADSPMIDLAVFYGWDENVVYTAQYEGRIYKLTGSKTLGYRRLAGQPAPGAQIGDGTYVTQSPEWFFPVIVGPTLPADVAAGGPTLGDYDDPNTPEVEPTGVSEVELFNADPNSPLDPIVSGRHYTGLAVDCGGRVYAVSERAVTLINVDPVVKYRGTQADVWNGAPGPYGPNRIETEQTVGDDTPPDPNDPNDPGNPIRGALFGDPWTTDVVVGDKVVLTSTDSGTSLPAQFLNVEFTILAIDPNGWFAKLDGDCGDSAANFDVNYTVYPPGKPPIPHPIFNPFRSWALVDVYQPDGTLDTTIDLNALTRPDGVSLGDYRYDGGCFHGVIVHGDVEVDPGLVYVSDPNAAGYDPNYPLDPLAGNATRLWIQCAGGDGNPDTDDGLDLVVVDVDIAPDGTVGGASFVGGIDDGDLPIGQFYQGLYETGFLPWDLWISFGDVEFDGQSNMAWMGGRGVNDNRYAGVSKDAIRQAVYGMVDESDPNSSNFGDGIVGIDAFSLDLNLYGFGTDFGMAFDNTPLSNSGGWPPPPPWWVLVDSEPDPNGSLPKTMNNVILCVFDRPIELPASGNPLVIRDMSNGCADVSNLFTYSIDPDDSTGCTLEAKENGDLLPDMTWYQVNSAAGWTPVEPFQFEVYTLEGDCDSSGRVTTADYSCIKAALGQRGDVRGDLNGSGRVTTADYSVVKANMGHRGPAKPAWCR